MAEQQAQHRRELEKTVVEADVRRANWGLAAGFVVAMAGFGVSAVFALTGYQAAGAVIAGLEIPTLAGLFVYGQITRKQERVEKAKLMTGQPAVPDQETP